MDEQPYLVVEEMDPKYRSSLNKLNLKEPLLRSRRRFIIRVHVVQFAEIGCYIGKNFGRNPHYMVSVGEYEVVIRRPCLLFDIPVVFYPSSRTISHTDLLVCFNFRGDCDTSHMCPQTKIIYKLLERIQSETKMGLAINQRGTNKKGKTTTENNVRKTKVERNVKSTLHIDQAPCCAVDLQELEQDELRGARQQHFGYSSNYSLSRLPKEQGGLVSPRIIGGSVTADCIPTFVQMTKLGDAVYSHDCSEKLHQQPDPKRLYDNDNRNTRFAQVIHADNRIEAVTYSETEEGGELLKIHKDSNNDDTFSGQAGNYNYVICSWNYVRLPDFRWKRIAHLAYSRRSVGDLFAREDSIRAYLKSTMTPWLQDLPTWRKRPTPDIDIFDTSTYGSNASLGEYGESNFPPTINKHATYLSSFVDAGIRLRREYEKVHKDKMSVEKQLEAVLPIVFGNSALPYVRVVDHWLRNNECVLSMPSTNLTVLFLETLSHLLKESSYRGRPRHQPTFNKNPSDLWIFESLNILRNGVLESRSNPRYSYQCFNQQLKQIKGIGDLLSQHLIHVMALSFIIPARYGAGAVVCAGTATSSRLMLNHGIKKSSFKCLLECACLEYNWLPYQAESALCKIGQDTNVRFRDAIYPSQESVYWIAVTGKQEYRVMRLDKKESSRSAITCTQLLNINTARINKQTSDSMCNMKIILENWWIPRRHLDLKAIQTRFADSDKCPTSRSPNTENRKRKRNSDNWVPIVKKRIDWRKMDEQEIRECTQEFGNQLRSAAMHLQRKQQDTLFGQNSFSRCGLDLRLIHNMGKLHCSQRCPSRFVNKRNTVPGLFKSVTNLIALGILDFQIDDLFLLTQRVTKAYYLRDNPGHVGGVILEVEIITLESNKNAAQFSVKGNGTLFGVRANLLSGHRREGMTPRILLTWSLGQKQECRLAVKSHHGSYRLRNHAGENSSATYIGFQTKKEARRAMLWYLLTMKECVSWIDTVIPRNLWRPTSSNSSTHTSRCPLYIIVSIGNMGNCKGEVLCILGRSLSRETTFVKMEATGRVFELSLKYTVDTETTKDDNADPPKLGAEEQAVVAFQRITPNNSQHTTHGRQMATKGKTPARNRTAFVTSPNELDPFAGRSATSVEHMMMSIDRWQTVWSHVLDEWRTSVVVRKTGGGTDRYWHPPGTSANSGLIRSPKDLQDFLNYSTQIQLTLGDVKPDFGKLLLNWRQQ